MKGFFIFLHILVSLTIILLVLLQPSKATGGLSGMMSGSAGTDTFFGKNKSRTYEGKLKRFTVIAMICFVLTSMTLIYLTNH